MPTAFERAHAFTARWEGGLVDHPDDPGGITNHGVSFRWVKDLAEEARRRLGGRVEPVTFTAKSKGELYAALRRRFEDKALRIPADRDLREDLHAVQRKKPHIAQGARELAADGVDIGRQDIDQDQP